MKIPSDGITDPKDALSVMDFEEAARRQVPIAHFAYIATGVDDDATLKANREGFRKIQLRPRRLVDVSKVDASVDLFTSRRVEIIPRFPRTGRRPDQRYGFDTTLTPVT